MPLDSPGKFEPARPQSESSARRNGDSPDETQRYPEQYPVQRRELLDTVESAKGILPELA